MNLIKNAIEWIFIIATSPIWLPLLIFKVPRERLIANYRAIKEEERQNKALK